MNLFELLHSVQVKLTKMFKRNEITEEKYYHLQLMVERVTTELEEIINATKS